MLFDEIGKFLERDPVGVTVGESAQYALDIDLSQLADVVSGAQDEAIASGIALGLIGHFVLHVDRAHPTGMSRRG